MNEIIVFPLRDDYFGFASNSVSMSVQLVLSYVAKFVSISFNSPSGVVNITSNAQEGVSTGSVIIDFTPSVGFVGNAQINYSITYELDNQNRIHDGFFSVQILEKYNYIGRVVEANSNADHNLREYGVAAFQNPSIIDEYRVVRNRSNDTVEYYLGGSETPSFVVNGAYFATITGQSIFHALFLEIQRQRDIVSKFEEDFNLTTPS